MQVKQSQKFYSKTTGNIVKVTRVARHPEGDNKHDMCTVANTKDGKIIKDTQRVICADTIRRHYLPVQ